jgi:hypothetical protein
LLDRPRVYSLSQFRSGPKHTDLGPKNERTCGPAGPWHYAGPVVVLQGQKTMSSAESFALALAQCPQVTTLGDRTAGSSGNPTSVDAGAGIVVNLPQWIDMDPAGKPIDAVGVPPRLKIEAKPGDFSGEQDPVLTAALVNLRGWLKTEKPPAGGVLQRRPGVPPPKKRPKVVSVSPAPDATEVEPRTEIRIRFDCPMDPNSMFLAADRDNAGNVFRLRGSPRYVSESKEFVIPVLLRPGVRYGFSFPAFPDMLDMESFWSSDGVGAAPYSWRFTTRAPAAAAAAVPPRVISIDAPSGSQTCMATTIRVRFDRPMDPEACELVGLVNQMKGDAVSAAIAASRARIPVPFPIVYDAASRCFTFQALLPGNGKSRIELRGFRGADGGQVEPVTVEYQVGAKLYRPEQEARIVEAGRSAKLHEVVEAVRRNRLAIKSLEETVRLLVPSDNFHDRPNWDSVMMMMYSRLGFQGDRQFYEDASGFFKSSNVISIRWGSNGKECWYYSAFRSPDSPKEEKKVEFCPYEAARERTVVICDPFGSKRFASTDKAIKELRLEYLGAVSREGKSCHRIRSWAGSAAPEGVAAGFWDCFIDAQSLLPVVTEVYFTGHAMRYEFLYGRINGPIAQEAFQAPAGADVQREPFEVKEGDGYVFHSTYDHSDGDSTARAAHVGPKSGKGGGR